MSEKIHDAKRLKELQALPLDRKIMITQARIIEWYQHWNGQVYVSFSGGKDSTVLLHIARQCYPKIKAIFLDTGLEYPEIREFVKTFDNVVWLRPKMSFRQVIEKYGWCYPSKDVARLIYYARKDTAKKDNYLKTLQGLNRDGTPSAFKERYKKYLYLVDSPFIISDECCQIIKERPLERYERQAEYKAILGTMAEESERRRQAWIKTGCNSYGVKRPLSQPISFWTEQDVLQYIKRYDIQICSVYGDIIEDENGTLKTTGENRTGCMFCPIGCHLDNPNKFQRMKITHPKIYDYCMRPWDKGGLGMDEFLTYIDVEH